MDISKDVHTENIVMLSHFQGEKMKKKSYLINKIPNMPIFISKNSHINGFRPSLVRISY